MRPRRKSATRARSASCRHPGIFIKSNPRYRLMMNALMARRNTRLPAMMAKNNLSKRPTPQSAYYWSRLEDFGCVDSLTHVRRSSGKSSGIKAARRLFRNIIANCAHRDARRKASAASAQEFYAVGPAAAPDHLAGLALRTFRHHRHHEVVPDIDGSVGHDLGAARRDVQDNAFNSRYAVIARKPGRPLVHFASRFTLGLCPQFINSHDDHPSLDQTGHSVSGQMDTGSHRKNASHSETGARF